MKKPPRRAAASARGSHVRYEMMMMPAKSRVWTADIVVIVTAHAAIVNVDGVLGASAPPFSVHNSVDAQWTKKKILGTTRFVRG